MSYIIYYDNLLLIRGTVPSRYSLHIGCFLLRQKFANDLQDPLSPPVAFQMAHVAAPWKRDPANPRDELKEWDLGDIMRSVILAIVDEGWSGDLRETRDDGPFIQRTVRRER